MLGIIGRSRRWSPILVAATLIYAASHSTAVEQKLGAPEGALIENAQTGSVGPGKAVGSASINYPCILTSAQRTARELAMAGCGRGRPPPIGRAPPLGWHTTTSQVGGNGGPPTVPPIREPP